MHRTAPQPFGIAERYPGVPASGSFQQLKRQPVEPVPARLRQGAET